MEPFGHHDGNDLHSSSLERYFQDVANLGDVTELNKGGATNPFHTKEK